MPDPLTPEDRRVLAAQIEEGRQVSPYSGARLLAALAAAEAERDAASADLAIADTLAQTLIQENVALRSPRPPGEGESDG